MTEYQLKYTTTVAHFHAYAAAVPWRITKAKRNNIASTAFRVGGGLVIGGLLLIAFIAIDQSCQDAATPCWVDPVSAVNGAIASFAFFWAASVIAQKHQMRRMATNEGAFLGPTKLTATPDRVEVFGDHVRATYDWEAFDAIEQDERILILWIDKGIGLFIPRTCFPDASAEDGFIEFCRDCINRAAIRKANIVHFT